jgi:hypothetical protein
LVGVRSLQRTARKPLPGGRFDLRANRLNLDTGAVGGP